MGYYSCPKDFNKVDKAELIRDCYYPYHDGYSKRGCRGLCERKSTVCINFVHREAAEDCVREKQWYVFTSFTETVITNFMYNWHDTVVQSKRL